MFERKYEKLAPVSVFVRRMAASVVMAGLLISVVLFIGISGYHWIAGLDWVDSLLEASMILGGMGPANPLKTPGAKIFASGYALFLRTDIYRCDGNYSRSDYPSDAA